MANWTNILEEEQKEVLEAPVAPIASVMEEEERVEDVWLWWFTPRQEPLEPTAELPIVDTKVVEEELAPPVLNIEQASARDIRDELLRKAWASDEQIEQDRLKEEFVSHFRENLDGWHSVAEKENEIKVINAIKVLFEHSDDIEIFNKKAIYLYMREITDLNTKQIATVLGKLKVKYRGFKADWDDGEIWQNIRRCTPKYKTR